MPFTSASPDAYVALAMQSGLGSLNTTPSKFRFVKYAAGNQFGFDEQVQFVREGGDGLDFGAAYKQRQVMRGQIQMNFRPEAGGQALAAALGGATWLGGVPSGIHRFHSRHASYPWNTIQAAHPGTDLITLMRDVRFTGFTMSGRTGQPLMMTLPYISIFAGASSNIALVPSYPVGDDFFVYHTSPSVILGGSADSTIEEWELGGAFNVEELQAQSVQLDEAPVMNRDFNFRVVRRYENSTLWKAIYYNGGVMPTSGFATTSFSAFYAIPGSPTRSFKIEAPLIVPNADTVTELNPDGVTVRETITGKPLSNPSGSIHVILDAAHASPYAA